MSKNRNYYKKRHSDKDIRLDVKAQEDSLERARCVFDQIDTEKDGLLTKEEFRIGFREICGDFPEKTINALFEVFDSGNDGYIDKKEWHQHLGRTLTISKAAKDMDSEELFATTCKAILKVKQRKRLREELSDFTNSLISFKEFKTVMRRLDKKYKLNIKKDEYLTIFSYFDVDGTDNISLANLERWLTQFEELERETQDIPDIFRKSVESIRQWEFKAEKKLSKTIARHRMNPLHRICADLINFAVFGLLNEPITVLAYFLYIFAQPPDGEDLPDYRVPFFIGIIRCFITFGMWFMELRRQKRESIPYWHHKMWGLLLIWALIWAVMSTVFYSEVAYGGQIWDCFSCKKCEKRGDMYYDPICWGDISAFAGTDDTCVCGINEDAQAGLDGPTRESLCIIGWDCSNDLTCEQVYMTATPGLRMGLNVTVTPLTPDGNSATTSEVGYIVSDFNEDDWTYDVHIPSQNNQFPYTLQEITLNSAEDSAITTEHDCYTYSNGWFFQSGLWILLNCWISTLLLLKPAARALVGKSNRRHSRRSSGVHESRYTVKIDDPPGNTSAGESKLAE